MTSQTSPRTHDLAHARDRLSPAHLFGLVVADRGEAEAAAAAGIVLTAPDHADRAHGNGEATGGPPPATATVPLGHSEAGAHAGHLDLVGPSLNLAAASRVDISTRHCQL